MVVISVAIVLELMLELICASWSINLASFSAPRPVNVNSTMYYCYTTDQFRHYRYTKARIPQEVITTIER